MKWEPKKYLSQKKLSGLFEKSVKCCTHSLRIICLWCRDLSCIRFHWLAYSHVQRRNSGHVVNHESWFYDAAWARNHFVRRHVLYWSLELQTSVRSTGVVLLPSPLLGLPFIDIDQSSISRWNEIVELPLINQEYHDGVNSSFWHTVVWRSGKLKCKLSENKWDQWELGRWTVHYRHLHIHVDQTEVCNARDQ